MTTSHVFHILSGTSLEICFKIQILNAPVVWYLLRWIEEEIFSIWSAGPILTFNKAKAKTFALTLISNRSDNCLALYLRSVFPAFVTNTVGTMNSPLESVIFLSALLAAGITVLPLVRTPSISKRNPKSGFCVEKKFSISQLSA